MADIDIEKKKPVWPWILLGLLILGAILAFFLWFDVDDDDTIDDVDDVESVSAADPVDDSVNNPGLTNDTQGAIGDYTAFLNEDMDMGIGHEYTHAGLTQLIAAVREVADDLDVDVDADLAEAKENADYIMKDPMDVDHANKIRNAVQVISSALVTIQQERFPKLAEESDSLRDYAQNVMPDAETLNQKEDVKTFFQHAEDLLTKMT